MQAIEDHDIEDAVKAQKSGLVFLDFDYTIFASNSTELFIASSKPGFLVAILDFLIRRCPVLQWAGLNSRTRDFLCCFAIRILSPWNILRWKRAAPAFFAQHESVYVKQALRLINPSRIVIITFGLEFIVQALLKGSVWEGVRLLATPSVTNVPYLKSTKLPIALQHYDADTISTAAFLTDSIDDYDLLNAVKRPILVKAQGAVFRAHEHLYLPLRYTARAKYPASYVLDQVLLVDIFLVAIAVSATFRALVVALFFVPFLFLSVMCVYEIGYYENDMVAAKREVAPTLTDQVERYRNYPIFPAAWVWSIILEVIAAVIAYAGGALDAERWSFVLAIWILSLLALRVLFFTYNNGGSRRRVIVYPILQLMKYLPILILFGATLPGVLAILAQIAMTTSVYLTYRHGGNPKSIPRETVRTVIWVTGMTMLAASGDAYHSTPRFAVGALVAWSIARLLKAPMLDMMRRRRA